MNFLKLFLKYIEYYRTATGFEKKKEGTIKAYEAKYSLTTSFLFENKIIDIKCSDFDNDTCESFFNWLLKNDYSFNYSVRVVEICQSVLDFGIRKKLIRTNNAYSFKLKRQDAKEPPYLSPEEIKLFENYNSESTSRQKASTMFVIQMHTGFDYGDFSELTRGHKVSYKGRKFIVKPRHKNGQKQIIPITPKLESILEEYNYNIRLLSNAKFNKYIKDVAKDLGIDIPLTTKDGRKIFFMNKLNNEGYHMEAASRMGGHKSIRTTEKHYAQVNINLISNELDRLGK